VNKKSSAPTNIITSGSNSNNSMTLVTPTNNSNGAGNSISGGNSNGFGTGGNNANGSKSTKDKVNEGTKSMKSGWLYKKRDIIAGWRHRYFKLYVGRIEYFTDHTALVPRGIIPLYAAEITGPKVCSVNGNDEHWSIT
jgi:hypothetical protein